MCAQKTVLRGRILILAAKNFIKWMLQSVNTTLYSVRIRPHASTNRISYKHAQLQEYKTGVHFTFAFQVWDLKLYKGSYWTYLLTDCNTHSYLITEGECPTLKKISLWHTAVNYSFLVYYLIFEQLNIRFHNHTQPTLSSEYYSYVPMCGPGKPFQPWLDYTAVRPTSIRQKQ